MTSTHIHWQVQFLCFLSLCLLLSAGFAQQLVSPAQQSFFQKDYPTYLAGMAQELTPAGRAGVPFEKVTMVAIALEKTHGWDGVKGTQARELLGKAPLLGYLEGFRQLLGGDTAALAAFTGGKAPEGYALDRAAALLKAHDYPLAANVLTVIGNGMPGFRMQAWAAIPADKRGPIDTYMTDRYAQDPINRKMLAQSALALYLRPQPGEENPEGLFDLTMSFGKELIANFDTAQQLAQSGRRPEAIKLVQALAAASPTDAALQRRAAGYLINTLSDLEGARTLYAQALKVAEEPDARDIRLDYLEMLLMVRDTPAVTALQGHDDPLTAGDAWLVVKDYERAATQYQRTLANKTALLGRRLAAWSGLLDSQPADALQTGTAVLEEIAKQPEPARDTLLLWYGWQLWRGVEREVPSRPTMFRTAERIYIQRLSTAPGWEVQVAGLYDKWAAADPAICARAHPVRQRSLRPALAMAYALSRHPEKAVASIYKKIDVQLMPPPGGWPGFGGVAAPDANKPRMISTPFPQESERTATDLVEGLARFPQGDDLLPPVAVLITKELTAKMQAAERESVIPPQLRVLAAVVKQTTYALNPPTAKEPADLKGFTGIAAGVRDALAIPNVAKQSPILLSDGLAPALTTVHDPTLLDALQKLAVHTLDRYAATTTAVQAAAEADTLARALEARKDLDMKLPAQALRARFPK